MSIAVTEKLTLTVAEVSALAGVSVAQVQAAIARGDLPAKYVGDGRRFRRVLRKDVEPWLDSLPQA